MSESTQKKGVDSEGFRFQTSPRAPLAEKEVWFSIPESHVGVGMMGPERVVDVIADDGSIVRIVEPDASPSTHKAAVTDDGLCLPKSLMEDLGQTGKLVWGEPGNESSIDLPPPVSMP